MKKMNNILNIILVIMLVIIIINPIIGGIIFSANDRRPQMVQENTKEENIRFVVSKFLKFFNQKEQSTIFYAPASKGEFKNLAKDEQIHQKFEELREILLKKMSR